MGNALISLRVCGGILHVLVKWGLHGFVGLHQFFEWKVFYLLACQIVFQMTEIPPGKAPGYGGGFLAKIQHVNQTKLAAGGEYDVA
jgi:hypothetical protein